MTDRELLELAAKAAGMVVIDSGGLGLRIMSENRWAGYMWNPLTDDGDALRLAVLLELPIEFWPALKTVAVSKPEMAHCEEKYGSNDCAATRRAIVRAAAEIGKGMK